MVKFNRIYSNNSNATKTQDHKYLFGKGLAIVRDSNVDWWTHLVPKSTFIKKVQTELSFFFLFSFRNMVRPIQFFFYSFQGQILSRKTITGLSTRIETSDNVREIYFLGCSLKVPTDIISTYISVLNFIK